VLDELKYCRRNVIVITKIKILVAFSCLLRGITDLYEKRNMLVP